MTGKASQPREKLFRRLEKFLSGLKIFSSGWRTLSRTLKNFSGGWEPSRRAGKSYGRPEARSSGGRRTFFGLDWRQKKGACDRHAPPESFLLGTYFVAGGVEGVGAAGVGAVVGVGGSGLVTVLRERLRSGWIPSSTSFSLRFP